MKIQLPDIGNAKPGWIVDGQQRALAISRSKRPDLPIPICAFITDDIEIPQYVSLTINFGEPQNSSARSMARTAIGTFEEIEALYVNAQRLGKNSFLYNSPGRPLTKLK